ncbi:MULTISPECIES: DUF317 domain-containing protein [unclassified Streptomyces]|uniref:DUF317 domain-containing protein n=1 Tax=unclassified Streptomyces TaxID=2593676 RepID=UPI00363D1AF4
MTAHLYTPTRARDPRGLIWFQTRPRYLAGGGDPRRITQTLLAGGWHNRSDPDYPHVVLAGPDHRHTLVLEPEPAPYRPWWTIRGHDEHGHWHSEFGANTPVEILSALTDALLAPAPQTSSDIWTALTSAHWHYERDGQGNETAAHPDGLLKLRRWSVEPGEHCHWTAEAATTNGMGGTRPIWRASLDDRMPRHLLAAFTTALARDEPVQRSRYDDHDARLEAVRAAARRARRAAARAASRAPGPAAAPATAGAGERRPAMRP